MRRGVNYIPQVLKSNPSAGPRLDPVSRVRSSAAAQRRLRSTRASVVFGILLSSSLCSPSSAASLAFLPTGASAAGHRVAPKSRAISSPTLVLHLVCLGAVTGHLFSVPQVFCRRHLHQHPAGRTFKPEEVREYRSHSMLPTPRLHLRAATSWIGFVKPGMLLQVLLEQGWRV